MSQGVTNEHKNKHIKIAAGEGEDWRQFREALFSVCPNDAALKNVLLNLQTDFNRLDKGNTLATIEKVITKFNAAFRIDDLTLSALKEEPENGDMLAWALKRGIKRELPETQTTLNQEAFERMLNKQRGFVNPVLLFRRMGQIINSVCQISVANKSNGTGFLISKNVVLTNYHVVEKVIDESPGYSPDKVKLKFDFQSSADGGDTNPGVEFSLDQDWLVGASKYDNHDKNVQTDDATLNANRSPNLLDYALLRVAGVPGESEVTESVRRGFIRIPSTGPDYTEVFQTSSGIYIFQHPRDEDERILPLRVDHEQPANARMDVNQLRVIYDVNTTPGSSGSPIFNKSLELIGLHHSGGKDWPADNTFLYNQGIPIDKIRSHMKSKGSWGKVYDA